MTDPVPSAESPKSGRRTLRIGGVPEHFNLPWQLAIEEGAFDALGLDAEWIDFAGGTGAIMKALAAGEIDMSTPLTEGAIASIAAGNPSRIVRVFVESPLLWGVHVAAASEAQTIQDAAGGRIAISRHGSGSELMGWVMGDDLGWELTADDFVVVGGLAGAVEALPAGDAELFLWSKSMTQPHVDDGTFRRVGIVTTPWPSFSTVATIAFNDSDPGLVQLIAETAAARAQAFAASDDAALMVVDRFGLALADAEQWLEQVRWAAPDSTPDVDMVSDVMGRMHQLGRIETLVPASSLLAQPSASQPR